MKTFKKHLKDKLTNKRFKDKFDEEKRLLEISMQIHNFREKKGMSQSDTAKLAKITQQQLSKIENGENCNLMTFLKVCSALNIDIDFKESKKSHAGA
ncbi:MAG TPA: helix-turn-helix transcriptional regulator [Spirochaetota bacterium]|nr:helix-turn-helix transcriptional regulator [Spirochaetota bacterium]HQQ22620.1 helix-turn-helix transcriptional regulator [Spirochaetota bacterium]